MRVAAHARTVIVGLLAGLVLGGQSSPVMASPYHPTGNFASFGDCPLANPNVTYCLFATVNGGSVAIGHRALPIGATITIQGGYYRAPEASELTFVGAEDANTLSSVPMSVPGGLTGLISSGSLPAALRAQLSGSPTTVTMTLQLARPASEIGLSTQNILFEEGVGLRLPLTIKLNNPFLGASCYIGSSSSPVVLSLTSGITSPPAPNKPIHGTAGVFEFTGNNAASGNGAVLVDNSFSAPVASGCGGVNAAAIDGLLDASLGLPSSAGHNTALLDSSFDLGSATAARESE